MYNIVTFMGDKYSITGKNAHHQGPLRKEQVLTFVKDSPGRPPLTLRVEEWIKRDDGSIYQGTDFADRLFTIKKTG